MCLSWIPSQSSCFVFSRLLKYVMVAPTGIVWHFAFCLVIYIANLLTSGGNWMPVYSLLFFASFILLYFASACASFWYVIPRCCTDMIDPQMVQVSYQHGEARVMSCLTVASQLSLGVGLWINCKPFNFVTCSDLVLIRISGAGISKGKYLYECSAQGSMKRREEIPMHTP